MSDPTRYPRPAIGADVHHDATRGGIAVPYTGPDHLIEEIRRGARYDLARMAKPIVFPIVTLSPRTMVDEVGPRVMAEMQAINARHEAGRERMEHDA